MRVCGLSVEQLRTSLPCWADFGHGLPHVWIGRGLRSGAVVRYIGRCNFQGGGVAEKVAASARTGV